MKGIVAARATSKKARHTLQQTFIFSRQTAPDDWRLFIYLENKDDTETNPIFNGACLKGVLADHVCLWRRRFIPDSFDGSTKNFYRQIHMCYGRLYKKRGDMHSFHRLVITVTSILHARHTPATFSSRRRLTCRTNILGILVEKSFSEHQWPTWLGSRATLVIIIIKEGWIFGSAPAGLGYTERNLG